jgi:hypothetical protein
MEAGPWVVKNFKHVRSIRIDRFVAENVLYGNGSTELLGTNLGHTVLNCNGHHENVYFLEIS